MSQTNKLKSSRPGKMKAYKSFAEWETEETKTNPLTKIIAEHVKAKATNLDTMVKWGQGCFTKNDTPVIYIHTEPDHVQLGFYRGVELDDPENQLEGSGKFVRHIKLVTESDLEIKNVDQYINQVS